MSLAIAARPAISDLGYFPVILLACQCSQPNKGTDCTPGGSVVALKGGSDRPADCGRCEGFDVGFVASVQVLLGGENSWLFSGFPGCTILWGNRLRGWPLELT